jgi:hypothetical protein
MNSREVLQKALNHEETEKLAVDFGAGGQTGIVASTIYKIKKHYGLLEKDERIKITEPYQMLGEVDEKMRDFFNLDVIGIHSLSNFFGFNNENYKPWTLFDGTPVWVPDLFNTEPNEDGGIYMYAEGDESYPPSAVMPKGGFYFDSTKRQKPIDESKLDPRDNAEEFGLISQQELDHFKTEVDNAYANTERGIYLTIGGAGFGDIAIVPAPFAKDPKGIRDVAEWYMSMALRPDYVKKVFEIQAEFALENVKSIYKAVGEKVQVVFMSGTDFGMQSGPMLSEATYRDIYFPYQKKLNDWIHANTGWKTFIHTCGSVEPLLNSILEAGYDVVNPVQCSAANMDPQMLKDKYGERAVFWGGGVDTQKTLPFGTPEEVKAEVKERIRIFRKGGGFVFCTIHNMQANIPIENIAAIFEAIKESSGQ